MDELASGIAEILDDPYGLSNESDKSAPARFPTSESVRLL
jgi:hypothetical protein